MRVLVAGAGGLLGAAVADRLRSTGHETIAARRDELDVTARTATRQSLRRLQPDVVIDCAAPCANDDHSALVAGAANLAAAARAVSAYSVYISCADVFDGKADSAYIESDVPLPKTTYGAAKLEAERRVVDANPRHLVVRTTWLFGPAGANVVDSILSDAQSAQSVTVEALTRSSPTYTLDLADAILISLRSPLFGIVHLTSRGSCTLVQLARAAVRAAKIGAVLVNVVPPEAGPPPPRQLVLATRRREAPVLPEWRVALRAYLRERSATTAGRSGR